MFIAYTNTQTKYVEGSNAPTWEDIPSDVVIKNLAITLPVSVPLGKDIVNPKVSIWNFHYFYFFNEAIASMISSGTGEQMIGNSSLCAKIMAGVDVVKEYVLEVRVDKIGNTSIKTQSLHDLKEKINNGLFRKEILRTGLNCPRGKNLL